IGNQYSSIASGIFAGCTSLRIVDASENGLYSVTDGYLVENSTKTILGFLRESLYRDVDNKTLYNNPDEYTVPQDVKVIGALSYYEASSFYNLIIPASVTEIQDRAFYGCSKIENIDLASTELVNVASTAIDGCGTLYSEEDAKNVYVAYRKNVCNLRRFRRGEKHRAQRPAGETEEPVFFRVRHHPAAPAR
ncbi:MAG: hypothetical protein EGQ09_11020, partial [Clostridiales bacterium]|nr:hypothetical protein [Clostridiales bacterium]